MFWIPQTPAQGNAYVRKRAAVGAFPQPLKVTELSGWGIVTSQFDKLITGIVQEWLELGHHLSNLPKEWIWEAD